jgi:CheY-like chemotaxis protein
VANEQDRPKVLIIEDGTSTRETLRVLLGSMGYQCVSVSNAREALAVLEHENPVIAIFDRQDERPTATHLGSDVGKIIARLRGRVIVVKSGESSPELNDLIGLYSLPHIRRDRLIQELWSNLEVLLRPSAALQRITRVARLIFDSFRQPLPAGVRMAQETVRRFVYECGSVSADVSFEPKTDSQLIEAVGQIMDSANPDSCLEGLPVVLRGPKGPIAMAMTNEFGEFRLDFDFEPKVTVEVQTSKDQWVTLISPTLEWAAKAASGGS